MFLIKLKSGQKYWTENYQKTKEGFFEIKVKTKEGQNFTHLINPDAIEEILDVGELEENKVC